MKPLILTKTYSLPPVNLSEVWRYAGVKTPDDTLSALLSECLLEAESCLVPKVCYGEFPLAYEGDSLCFGFATVSSKDLKQALEGCNRVILFGATIGIGMDRLIAKYGSLSPTKALLFQALGAERIEALCDCFCKEFSVTRRFSPGYGDLPLSFQKDLFRVLDCARKIGLTLNDSLLMSPTKSVTAIAGKTDTTWEGSPCDRCTKKDCSFRRNL
jgi:hypothetical protein